VTSEALSRLDDLDPVEPQLTHEIVAEALRRRVALGWLAPGDRIPSERELAELLGVGRMTLRAAIRDLNREGLLETRRGRTGGTFVSLVRTPEQLDRVADEAIADLKKNYEFRIMLEPDVARLAAARAGRAESEELERLAGEQATTVASYRAQDSRFHLEVARCSENPYAVEAIERARREFFVWADAVAQAEWPQLTKIARRSEAEHVAIAAAIAAGDAQAAGDLMHSHLTRGSKMFRRFVGASAGAAVPSRSRR
jgi:GntR family transcriptional repressor for pyruvate dehydrogenase complex